MTRLLGASGVVAERRRANGPAGRALITNEERFEHPGGDLDHERTTAAVTGNGVIDTADGD
jgi:hypothetical protein